MQKPLRSLGTCMRFVIYILYGSDTCTAGQGNIDRSGCAKNCCIISTVNAAVALCIASCADLGSLEIGVNAFRLYSCDTSKRQYHQHFLLVTQQRVHNSYCVHSYILNERLWRNFKAVLCLRDSSILCVEASPLGPCIMGSCQARVMTMAHVQVENLRMGDVK